MIDQIDRAKRVVLVTGKGGVGKTTVTASLLRVLSRDRKVLGCEIGDLEGSPSALGRLFGRTFLTPEPAPVSPRLTLCHLWAPLGHELFLRSILHARRLVRAALRSKALRRFLTAAPSFHEMGIFYHLLTLLEAEDAQGRPRHDTLVIDMPATGHALALTSLVDVLLRLIPTGPVHTALLRGDAIVRDPARSTTFVVTLPERLPVSEALELAGGLGASRMPLGGVVLNRIPEDPMSDEEREALAPVLERHRAPPLLGSATLARIEESRKAATRLAEATSLPHWELPEIHGEAPTIVEGLARHLSPEGVPA